MNQSYDQILWKILLLEVLPSPRIRVCCTSDVGFEVLRLFVTFGNSSASPQHSCAAKTHAIYFLQTFQHF